MASGKFTQFSALVIGAATLSVAAFTTINAIRDNTSGAETSPLIALGDQYLVTADNPLPQVFLDDDGTNPVKIYPTTPGVEHCEGNTGALLCQLTIKLTGSGGNRNHNAGSFLCSTSTCSITSTRVFTEAIPRANERLYGGWTNAPGTASGAQLYNFYAASSGATIIGSGSYISGNANGLNVEKDVPPGATIKFVWALGNGSEDYGTYIASAVITYWRYWRP